MHSELIARLEAATADQQRELLIEVFLTLHGNDAPTRADLDLSARFSRMILAEAYESAALTLVPEGWTYVSLEVCGRGLSTQHCRVSVERLIGQYDDERIPGYASTPALAIVIAALRAKGDA